MMKNIKIIYILLLAIFVSCEPNIDKFESDKGEANFSTYVAIGNSLTAGYSNGALYKSGQKVSFANLLAQQFKKVGGGEFGIPFIQSELGMTAPNTNLAKGIIGGANIRLKLALTDQGLKPKPFSTNFSELESWTNVVNNKNSINNFGVPGALVAHLLSPTYGDPAGFMTKPVTANQYYTRFAPSKTTSVLEAAMSKKPTFFTLWIGNNDILGYASEGGEQGSKKITPFEGVPGVGFKASYNTIVQTLLASKVKGALATIPSITSSPFFTYIKYNSLTLEQKQADNLNAAYKNYNLGAEQIKAPKIIFVSGANAFIIQDNKFAAIGGIRQIKKGELIRLNIPSDSIKFAGWGTKKPIPAEYILDATEIEKVTTATKQFNDYIRQSAKENGFALVDSYKLILTLNNNSISKDGIKFTTDYITGNLFSLDGVHLTGRGNAFIANEYIKSINSTYNANVPMLDVSIYQGVVIP